MGSLCHKALQIISELCLGGQVEREKCAGIFPLETARQGIGGTGTATGPGPAAPFLQPPRGRPESATFSFAFPACRGGGRRWGGGGEGRHAARFKILSTRRLRVRSAARKAPPGTSHLGWAHRRGDGDGDGCGSGEHRGKSKGVRSSPTCEPCGELEPRRRRSPAAPGGSVTPRFSLRRAGGGAGAVLDAAVTAGTRHAWGGRRYLSPVRRESGERGAGWSYPPGKGLGLRESSACRQGAVRSGKNARPGLVWEIWGERGGSSSYFKCSEARTKCRG